MKRTTNIGTWNVRGISTKTAEIIQEMEKYGLDIIILNETKKKGSGNENLGNFIHVWSGIDKSERASCGVSILIRNHLKKFITNFQYVSKRILAIEMKLYGHKTIILGVYAPYDTSDNETKDKFYEELNHAILNIKTGYDIIIAGDLNAKVKSQQSSEIVGKYAETVENDNGERLLQLCSQYQLKLTNTFFAHKDIHRYTWERPSLNQKSIIDYVIVKTKSKFKVYDSRVKRGANCGTDHHLLTTKIVYPFPHKPSKVNTSNEQAPNPHTEIKDKQYKLYLLKQQSIKEFYEMRLQRELELTPPEEDIETEYTSIKNIMHKIAAETLGEQQNKNNNKRNMYLTKEVKELSQEKNRIYKKYLTQRTETNRQEYKEANKKLRQKIKCDKNNFWERKCSEINAYIGGAQATEVWQTIKGMKTNRKERFSLIDREKWRVYYKALLTEERDIFMNTENMLSDTLTYNKPRSITVEEVKVCVQELKNGRAPGPGGIVADLIKNGGISLWKRIRELFNHCLEQRKTPKEFKQGYITSLYKKGDKKDPDNYRGLCVTSTLSRLWAKILQKRLREEVGDKISEDQSGFTPGRSCVDNLFILQQLIEKRSRKNEELHIAFIDLKKAYDGVPRNKLFTALRMIGVSDYMILLIRELYEENNAYIKQGRSLSESIQVTKGLRQGCCLSPLLFNIYLEMVLRQWKRSCQGMGISVGEDYLFTLSFADDQAVLAQDAYDLEFMLSRLYAEYQKWGLEVSIKKTEYLAVNSNAQFEVLLNDEICIKQVEEFKYLGVLVDRQGIGDTELKHRTKSARKVIGSLNMLWWDKHISSKNKKRIGQTMVESVLCYGSEIWALKEEDKRKLLAIEMDYLRRSARVSRLQRVRNEEIRNRMKATESVIQRVEKRGLRWFGHLLRMDDTRWPKRIFQWTPPGKNKRGRPRRSWNEGIRQTMRDRGMEEDLAYDREGWRLRLGMQHLAV